MPSKSGLRFRSETNLYHHSNTSNNPQTMIGPVKTIDHNDINPDLLLLGDNYIKSEVDPQYSDTGKTFVNLDNKHWQGGSTTVLEERDLPVVFQDIVGRSVSPGSTTSSTSSSTGTRASRRPGRKSAATNRQEEEEFSPEEAERLKIRRERNKEAAARCRKRKLDQIETLEKQVSDWESKTSQLQKELINLKHERDELQYLLEQHSNQCRYTAQNTATLYPAPQQIATTQPQQQQETILRVPSLPTTSTTTRLVNRNNNNRVVVKNEEIPTSSSYSRHQTTAEMLEQQQQVPIVVEEAQDVYTTIAPVTAKRSRPSRPVSLSLSVNAQNLRSIEGVPIETPTNVFTQLNFDSLMDGRTGLTPTNILTPVSITMSTLTTPTVNLSSPTCSSQQRNNASNGVSADKNLKLVSL